MSNGWKIFSIVALAILIPGGVWIGIGALMLTKMAYSLAGVKITGVSLEKINMTVGIKIQNPSEISVDVLGYDLTFYINEKVVARATNATPQKIEKSAGSILAVPFSANLKETFGALGQTEIFGYFLSKQYDKISISVEGKISAKAVKISMDYTLKKDEWTWTLADIFAMMEESKKAKNGSSK